MLNLTKLSVASLLLSISSLLKAEVFVRDDIILEPVPEKFNICHGGTCENISDVSLTEQQWKQIKEILKNNKSPELERQKIKMAIAQLEKFVGRQTETFNDKSENKTDEITNHYMDCIDESTNTTLYLMMMQNDNLLRWHTYQDRGNRGYFFNGWPHTTAIIKETNSEKVYAVDSWFLDNGEQPYIIPYKKWKNGWRPANKDIPDK